MRSSLKRLGVFAASTCAIVGSGPVAFAGAATPVPTSAASGTPLFPGLSCSVNQGLLPGIPNLGPTGPLGPLGPSGPLGGTNNNLPCGASVFNLGPTGPLGPGGALGSGQQAASTQQSTSTQQPSTAQRTSGKSDRSKHAPGRGTRTHRQAGHTRAHRHGKHGIARKTPRARHVAHR